MKILKDRTRPAGCRRLNKALIWLTAYAALLAGCATSTAPVQVEEQPTYWSISRSVESASGMVTLFDPVDLRHHEADPEDWYLYDFAFANDLETGRFAAVMTEQPGNFHVRLTSGPLTELERTQAGPRAMMRLRVINDRLLLSGGDTWPSERKSSRAHAYDNRWINFANGDYRIIITALDRRQGAAHDFVFQIIPVEDMLSVAYAPGIPYLVMGQSPGVVGINAGGLSYRESCSAVPSTAEWSPLTSIDLPVPGSEATIAVAANLHERGTSRQKAGLDASLPIVVARNPEPGTVGLYIEPDRWDENAYVSHGEVPVTTRILCAVNILGVAPDREGFRLQIEPLRSDRQRLTPTQVRDLVDTFDNWVRVTGDPAWLFKSAQIQRTRDQRSLMLGIMDYLDLNVRHSESLLQENTSGLAVRLLEHMGEAGGRRLP